MVGSEEIKLPAEFQVALYEDLVEQLEERGGFEHVYRDGDRHATERRGTVVLHSTVKNFKQGIEGPRAVATATESSSITLQCRFIDANGHILLQRDIKGAVRFFAGNLKATHDLAKKAADVARELSVQQSPKPANQAPILDESMPASIL